MGIKDWGAGERPRERLVQAGEEALSNSELIGIILRTGSGRLSAVDLGRELLQLGGNTLVGLSRMSLERLERAEGIGRVKAVTLKAAFELGRRFARESNSSEDNRPVSSSARVFEIMYPRLKGLEHEECWVLFLNRAGMVISVERISSGGSSSTVVDRKIILRMAVEKMAGSIILVHNHPSGSRFPGECDIRETRMLKEAAKLMDISLLDHVIIAGDSYYSFSDEG